MDLVLKEAVLEAGVYGSVFQGRGCARPEVEDAREMETGRPPAQQGTPGSASWGSSLNGH